MEYSLGSQTQVTGILENVDYLTEWQQHPDVLYARPLVQVGGPGASVAAGSSVSGAASHDRRCSLSSNEGGLRQLNIRKQQETWLA